MLLFSFCRTMVPWFGARITSNVQRYVPYNCISVFFLINFGISVESQEATKVVREKSHVLFTLFPPMFIPYIFIAQYYKQKIIIGTRDVLI